MWYEYTLKRDYGVQQIKIIVEGDSAVEAIERYHEWIKNLENSTSVDDLFKNRIDYKYKTSAEWDVNEREVKPHYMDYDFEVAKPKQQRRISIVIDFSEDPSIPLAIRGERFYYGKTVEEMRNIKELWEQDFDISCTKIDWPDKDNNKKFVTYYYKAVSKKKE